MTTRSKAFKATGGWVKISMDAELKTILMRSGILRDKMIMPGAAWVPKWVKDAINMYHKGEGFAGLSLEDFLANMRPTTEG